MKSTFRCLSFMMIVVILTSACQVNSNPGQKGTPTNGGSGAPSGGQQTQERFNAPANPLNLTLQMDEPHAASAIIPAKGGELSATGADGSVFKLTIPAGALLVDTEIRMTPVSQISDLTFSGGLGGADLSHLFVAQAPLVNTEFQFVSDNSDCKTTSIRGGGNFDVTGLGLSYETKNNKDILKDVTLRYFPGVTSESYTIKCPDSSYTSPPGGYWTGIYLVLHFEKEFGVSKSDVQDSAPKAPPMPQIPSLADMLKGIDDGSGGIVPVAPMPMPALGSGAEGGFVAKNWKIAGGDIVATKEWDMKDPSTGIFEQGKFILFHKPGK